MAELNLYRVEIGAHIEELEAYEFELDDGALCFRDAEGECTFLYAKKAWDKVTLVRKAEPDEDSDEDEEEGVRQGQMRESDEAAKVRREAWDENEARFPDAGAPR